MTTVLTEHYITKAIVTRKTGAEVCAYVKHGLKANVLKHLSGIGESGVHQLWLQVQNKKLRSVLVCIAHRPPKIGLA